VSKTQPARALKLEHDSQAKLEKMGIKFVKDVDKSGFQKAAQPLQDQLAAELGPGATNMLKLVRGVK
jgi:TRAP-type C4-dicarboxylate transport system substrate-binding protein